MSLAFTSLIFFIVGFAELAIDKYETLVSVRLKLMPALLYGALNNTFDFFMNIFLFGYIISFWNTWHSGTHDYMKLIPYVFYAIGRTIGVGGAIWLYARLKKQLEHEKAVKHIENTKSSKKKKSGKKKKITEPESIFDAVEADDVKAAITARVIESATQQISEKIDAAFNETQEKK